MDVYLPESLMTGDIMDAKRVMEVLLHEAEGSDMRHYFAAVLEHLEYILANQRA